MKRARIIECFSVGLLVIFILGSGCAKQSDVVFWPHDAVKRKPGDFEINSMAQSVAIYNANPEGDADMSFSQGDLRLIGDRLDFPRFFGVPEAFVGETLRRKYEYKVVGVSETLYDDENFRRRKLDYEERYNKKLYDLIEAQKRLVR